MKRLFIQITGPKERINFSLKQRDQNKAIVYIISQDKKELDLISNEWLIK